MSATISVSGAHPSAVSTADLFNQIAAGVSLVNGQSLSTIGTETLRISRKHAGLAIILGCVLLFPIGLLFLLARQTETISVTATESEGGVTASAVGTGDPQVVSFLNELLLLGPA